ncbi:MAG: PKD domain-containing protein [Euryarchaeota archaeon]|nr:PKD domain-containing protein [Euryarchaeota archaeon]
MKRITAFMLLFLIYSPLVIVADSDLGSAAYVANESFFAEFSASPLSGIAPLTVKFTDSSNGSPTNWEWDFNSDGIIDSTEKNPIYTYSTPGIYSATLTATNSTVSDEITKSNYITVEKGPTADFSASPLSGIAPLTVRFTDSSTGNPTKWEWDFNSDGTIDSTEKNPVYTYSTAGTYSVTLTVTNSTVSDKITKSNYITVEKGPTADFSASPLSGTAPLTVSFTDSSTGNPTKWAWDFNSDGTIDSTEKNPVFTYSTAGTYSVTLTVTNSAASDEITKSNYITVGNGPTASFIASPLSGIAPLTVSFTDTSTGDPTKWEWDFGDGNKSNDKNPSHTYSGEGTYTVKLTVTNSYGSYTFEAASYIRAYSITAPVANFSFNPVSGPAPLSVQFQDLSTGAPISWEWDFNSDGIIDSTEQNPTYVYESQGTYSITLKAINGTAAGSKTIPIIVGDLPLAAFTVYPREGNAPLTVQFNDASSGNATSWLWDFGDGNESTSQSPSHTYFDAGNYTVGLTVTNAFGSNATVVPSSVNVLSLNAPIPDFTSNVTSGPAPLFVQFQDLSAGDPTAWEWDFNSDGIIDSTENNPVHKFTTNGLYTVTLRAGKGTAAWGNITRSNYIMVGDELHASFTASTNKGSAPLTVQFKDTSTGNVTRWFWDFGDNSTSTSQNPTHEYSKSGSYSVTLNVSNDYKHSTVTWTDYIKVGEEESSRRGSGGSFGASSAGGGGSPEPASNVEVKEIAQDFITTGDRIKFEFTKNATAIMYVKFDSKRNFGKTTSIVEELKNRSFLTPKEPSGKVYKYLNIWVGNEGVATPENIANASIGFRVKSSEISENETEGPSVFMYRYSNGKWKALPTRKIGEDGKYMYFESRTPGFSTFAIITGKKAIAIEYNENNTETTVLPLESDNMQVEVPESRPVPAAEYKDWSNVSTAIKILVAFMVILLIGIALTERKNR